MDKPIRVASPALSRSACTDICWDSRIHYYLNRRGYPSNFFIDFFGFRHTLLPEPSVIPLTVMEKIIRKFPKGQPRSADAGVSEARAPDSSIPLNPLGLIKLADSTLGPDSC